MCGSAYALGCSCNVSVHHHGSFNGIQASYTLQGCRGTSAHAPLLVFGAAETSSISKCVKITVKTLTCTLHGADCRQKWQVASRQYDDCRSQQEVQHGRCSPCWCCSVLCLLQWVTIAQQLDT
jgi:hypothetical protein